MPRTVSKLVYQYDELPTEAAKTKARDWYREASLQDEWWDCVYEDARTCLECLGFGNEQAAIDINFSGFSSQGDGASFTGGWAASRVDMSALTEYAPEDQVLHKLCSELSVFALEFPDATAKITRSTSNYVHSGMMDVEMIIDEDDEGQSTLNYECTQRELTGVFRGAANWIYKQLEQEYDSINSDGCVVENIQANEYEFDEDGEKA